MKKASVSLALVTVVLLAVGVMAEAQQLTKMPRVGYLVDGSLAPPQAFVKALRDLGYVEGSNIAVDFRTTDGNSERNFDVAAELVKLKVDIIVADGSGPSLAAKRATSTIPIVMTTSSDPVTDGLVASLARPGGNITGLIRVNGTSGEKLAAQSMIGELLVSGKRLGLLKEILPKISRVGILRDASSAPIINSRWYEPVAGPLKVEIQYFDVQSPSPNFESTFEAAVNAHVNALIMVETPRLKAYREQIADLAAKNGLVLMSETSDAVEAGSLVSYGWPDADAFRRVAIYVDKILKGAKPAELPVEMWPCIVLSATTEERPYKEEQPSNCLEPTRPELVINLKTAKQIGLTIPPNVLVRADRVIR